MDIEKQLRVNMYGQSIIGIEGLVEFFNKEENKRFFLEEFIFLIQQSKPLMIDIDYVIKNSELKDTCTPCIMIHKGINEFNLRKIINLPDYELVNVFILFLGLFKVAYQRRFLLEKNNPTKWWYWDLTNKVNVKRICKEHNVAVKESFIGK